MMAVAPHAVPFLGFWQAASWASGWLPALIVLDYATLDAIPFRRNSSCLFSIS